MLRLLFGLIMTRLKKVLPSEFDKIHMELLRELDPSIPRGVWQRLFLYGWNRAEDYVGFALVKDSDDTPVGFMGLIFSEMVIDGKPERLCNVTSWVAKDDYKAESTAFVFALRNLKEYTITNLSCNKIAYNIFTRLGFKPLETHKRVISIAPALTARLRSTPNYSLFDAESISEKLDPCDRKLLQEHLPYTKPMLIGDDNGCCLLLYTLATRRRLGAVRIHYMSSTDEFCRHLRNIQWSLLRRHGAVFLECDERFLQGIPISMSYKIKVYRLFKSRSLQKEQIPNCYSELVLLNLN